jgi:hypothetical protein
MHQWHIVHVLVRISLADPVTGATQCSHWITRLQLIPAWAASKSMIITPHSETKAVTYQ